MPLPKSSASTSRAVRVRAVVSALAVGCLLAVAGAACSSKTSDAGAGPSEGGVPASSGSSSGISSGSNQGAESGGTPSEDAGTPAATSGSGGTQGPEGDAGTPATSTDASAHASPEAGPVVVTCPTTVLQPGDSSGSLMSGGAMRTYVLHVPKGYTGKTPIPLVVDYHALESTSAGEEQTSGYPSLGDTEGYATVLPQGIDNAWNVGPCCTTSRTVDDLGFTRAFVKDVQSKICVDPKRIYAVGYSMGGGASHYVACNAADLFAAVAPAAFDLLIASEEPCNPSRPITEISFRGTADPLVNYDGGASMPPSGLQVTIHFLGAQGTFQKWAQLDGCTGSPSAPDTNGCSTYSQCKDGVEATLCTKQGGGHEPGNAQIGWAMLKAHPMP